MTKSDQHNPDRLLSRSSVLSLGSVAVAVIAVLISSRSCRQSNEALFLAREDHEQARTLIWTLNSKATFSPDSVSLAPADSAVTPVDARIIVPSEFENRTDPNLNPPDFRLFIRAFVSRTTELLSEANPIHAPPGRYKFVEHPALHIPMIIESRYVARNAQYQARSLYYLRVPDSDSGAGAPMNIGEFLSVSPPVSLTFIRDLAPAEQAGHVIETAWAECQADAANLVSELVERNKAVVEAYARLVEEEEELLRQRTREYGEDLKPELDSYLAELGVDFRNPSASITSRSTELIILSDISFAQVERIRTLGAEHDWRINVYYVNAAEPENQVHELTLRAVTDEYRAAFRSGAERTHSEEPTLYRSLIDIARQQGFDLACWKMHLSPNIEQTEGTCYLLGRIPAPAIQEIAERAQSFGFEATVSVPRAFD